jgi:hypothetical protein
MDYTKYSSIFTKVDEKCFPFPVNKMTLTALSFSKADRVSKIVIASSMPRGFRLSG